MGEALRLRVAEALAKDVGRGIARFDPKDMELLEARVGDVVQLTGTSVAVARVMPAYRTERGRSLAQIDGILRVNAGAGLGSEVVVEKVVAHPAQRISLAPVATRKFPLRDRDARFLNRTLDGIPVRRGNRVRVNLLGSAPLDLLVLETAPDDAVVVTPDTQVAVASPREHATAQPRVAYEDVGGLGKQIHRVREMIELPLKHPEIFERLGIDPPKGVLLHGPPGTGKTLIARAVAHETDAYFTHVSGPEIMHKYYGESEARLREIFDEARARSPSIIFLDEIDAIAPKREEVRGDVERRVVAQLLSLMDGLEPRGQVVVIGATNLPNLLDPALRRPGRFDRELEIGVPDRNGRLEILQIHTRGMPLADDVDLDHLADVTHGFVGADLEALCREAAMSAFRHLIPRLQGPDAELPYEVLLNLRVTMDDFRQALPEIGPSATRELVVEVPDVGWSDIGGLDGAKAQLQEALEWPLRHPDLFRHARIEAPRGILLCGPPGTGKTLLAKAAARETQANFISVKGPELLSKWVGESEKAVREVFRKARQAAPCVIFFDEFDALVPARRTDSDSAATDRVVSQILTEIDGLEELRGVVVLAATNRPDLLDPALIRPGRFDLVVRLSLPDERERTRIFAVHMRGRPLGEGLDLEALASLCGGFSGADIRWVCQRASLLAMREFLGRRAGSPSDPRGLRVRGDHLRQAIEQRRCCNMG